MSELNELIAQPAQMSGQAGRISKAEKDALEAAGIRLVSGSGVIRGKFEITRAGTGEKVPFEIVGIVEHPKEN